MMRMVREMLPQLTAKVRSVRDATNSVLNFRRLKKEVKSLQAASDPLAILEDSIPSLFSAWGNPGWSAKPIYMKAAAVNSIGCRGVVLDCGSGLSTILSAIMIKSTGGRVVSLEQDAIWCEYVSSMLVRLGIDNVDLRYAPLSEMHDFLWYDVDIDSFPTSFSLVLCDGPSIPDGTFKWRSRYGLLPVLDAANIRVEKIVADDTHEPRMAQVVSWWESEFGFTSKTIGERHDSCAILTAQSQDIVGT